jgi:RimJ/RimL family protein N-acetyltransferase
VARRRHRLGAQAVLRDHLGRRSRHAPRCRPAAVAGFGERPGFPPAAARSVNEGNAIPNPRDLTLRRLVPADAPAYRALRLRGLDEHPDAFTSSFEEESLKPLAATEQRLAPGSDDAVWGAFAGDTLAGVAGLGSDRRQKVRHKAVLFGMYVAPEHAGRGVGTALLRHVIGEARRQPGLEQLILTVTENNAGARTLYEKAGFRSFGVEPRAIRVGDRYHGKNHMILLLAPP